MFIYLFKAEQDYGIWMDNEQCDGYDDNKIEDWIKSASLQELRNDLGFEVESNGNNKEQARRPSGQFSSDTCVFCDKRLDPMVGYGELTCGHKFHWEQPYFDWLKMPFQRCIKGTKCKKEKLTIFCQLCKKTTGMGAHETGCYCSSENSVFDNVHADELELKLRESAGRCQQCQTFHPGYCHFCQKLFVLTSEGPPRKVYSPCCSSYYHRECCSVCGVNVQPDTKQLSVARGRIGGRSVTNAKTAAQSAILLPQMTLQTAEALLMPPPSLAPRRSNRIRSTPAPSFTPERRTIVFATITDRCQHFGHFGVGCGAKSANHLPDYYDSLKQTTQRCPYCGGLLLPREAIGPTAFSKCCAKGRVHLRLRFDDMQKRPNELMALFINRNQQNIRWHNELIIKSMQYNDNLSFGQIRIQRQRNFPEHHRIVKCNNMIQFMLWDFRPPTPDLPVLHGQLYTIPPASARTRISEISTEKKLNAELLDFLYKMLQKHHAFAKLYETAAETFSRLDENEQIHLRLLLIDTNTLGKELSVSDNDRSNEINPADEHNARQIHPGRINMETIDGSKLVAQFYMDDGSNVPPSHQYDVVLTGRQGSGKREMKWWNRNVDPTLFPLLFTRGQFGFEYGVKLRLPEGEHFDPKSRQLRDINDNIVEDDIVLGEEQEFLSPELERQFHRRDNVSRAQWFRYMAQNRGQNWNDQHFLWDWHDLAQLYVIVYNNRMEAQKVQKIKQLQGQRRLVRSRALLGWLEKLRDQQGLTGPIGQVYMTDVHFRGSRQYYQKEYANCMTICREIGKPDVFLTFTMSPDCPELDEMLSCGPDGIRQQWYDRPDIVCRLFIDKRDEMLDDLVKRHVLGTVKAWFFALEHQLRGLPHMHICLMLNWDCIALTGKINTKEDYMNEYICAEIPAKPSGRSIEDRLQLQLYNTITTKNIHTCTEQRCLVDGKCKKHFPKPFSYDCVFSENSYPRYKRRPPAPSQSAKQQDPDIYGNTFSYKNKKGRLIEKNNSHVVSFNPFLSAKYRSHINVEFIAGDGCTKYICKYVMKGADMAFVRVSEEGTEGKVLRYDEFNQIRLTRYITSMEAFMSLWGVPLVQRSHQVDELDVHGPDGHRIAVEQGFEDEEENKNAICEAAQAEEERRAKGTERITQLTAYFMFNKTRQETGLSPMELTYATAFKKMWYDSQKRRWCLYINEGRAGHKLCRLKSVSPANLELLAIRLLLFVVKDPVNWTSLLTHNGHAHYTFIESAKAQGLLNDNHIWKRTVLEAFATKKSIRQRIRWLAVLFATANLTNAAQLLDEILNLPEEWLVNTRVAGRPFKERQQYVLNALEWFLRAHGVETDDLAREDGSYESACEHIGLPRPDNFMMISSETYVHLQFFRDDVINARLEPELRDPHGSRSMRNRYLDIYQNGPHPNQEQKDLIKEIYDGMTDARYVLNGEQTTFTPHVNRLFMVTGERGAGKTFTYNKLIALLKATDFNFLPMAATGIAAELLYEGQTVHKRICRRKHIDASTPLSVDADSNFAEMLRRAHGLLIDEISMQHKNVIEFVDKLLRSVAPNQYLRGIPFAGKVVVLGGDWKQLAPVIPGGGSLDQMNASVKFSTLFKHFVTRRLLCNHRLSPGQDNYRKFVLRVGTGQNNNQVHRIRLNPQMCISDRESLIEFVFPNNMLNNPLENGPSFGGCAILSPLNKETFELNNIILDRIQGAERTYIAITQPVSDDTGLNELKNAAADANYENLQRFTPAGIPEHFLRIKVGAVMMITINVSIADGLCNGTRVQVLPGPNGLLTDHIIRCRILTGNKKGKQHDLHAARFVFGGDPVAPHEGPIKCERIQFPLRPGSVMTINKSQGQTLSRVGVLLDQSQCFSHGQLYVALSRVKDAAGIRICTKHPQLKIKNVVMQELLDNEDLENAQTGTEDTTAFLDDNESDHEIKMDVNNNYEIPAPSTSSTQHYISTITQSPLDLKNVSRTHLSKIKVVKGDITLKKVDMIVNAANPRLQKGAGVDDAVHRACLPEMDRLIQALKILHMSNGCDFPAGCVVVTEAYGRLRNNTEYIAHAIGPNVQGRIPTDGEITALRMCYVRSLDALIDKKRSTIAFPSISTGAFGFPQAAAAKIALEAVLHWLTVSDNSDDVHRIVFVCFKEYEEQLCSKLLQMAKRSIGQSCEPTPRRPSISHVAVIPHKATKLKEVDVVAPPETNSVPLVTTQQITSTVPYCYNVIGDGDCFYRAVCYSLFRVDESSSSNALRIAAGRTLNTIVNNTDFYPRKRHRTHADFLVELRLALLASPSAEVQNQSLTNYAEHITKSAQGIPGTARWAQLADAHTIAILLRRPVVILRPIAEQEALLRLRPQWNNRSVQQRIDVYFPDGEYMGKTCDVEHSSLNNFAMRRHGRQNTVVERAVVNAVVIWFDGIGHFQSIVFDSNLPCSSAGSSFITSEEIEIPPNFLSVI